MYPENLRYSQSHEWVRAEDDLATVGITDFAAEELGDIVNIELPEVGTMLTAGQAFGSIDSVKAASELIAPVSGEVVEVNEDLETTPELVNQEPFGSGWMIIIKMEDPSEVDSLMTSDEYEHFIEAE
jgi:glycine cleavage system H protein